MSFDQQLYSSNRQDWATPQALFDALHAEFNFELDAAASAHNAKCPTYLDEQTNALEQDWATLSKGGAVWLNPPYGREIGRWVQKASQEGERVPVVVLIFARTDTRWWHEYAMKAAEIRLIPGRVTFGVPPALALLRASRATNVAPAPSCVLVFDEARRRPIFFTQELPRK